MEVHLRRTESRRGYDSRILRFALGYFLFYIPYSALTKSLSQGLLPGMDASVPGLLILPATVIAIAVAMPLFITALGWWKYAGSKRLFRWSIPFPSSWSTVVSGLGFAVVIATTTLAYTFEGVSIVFALLLMRGGVLLMAPIVDVFFRRDVRWSSWAALTLSLLALGVAVTDSSVYVLSLAAIANLAAYLGGYSFRLQLMTRQAKKHDATEGMRFLVEEQMVAVSALLGATALLAFIGATPGMLLLRRGFTEFLWTDLSWAALSIGALYACLGIFGTLIYLDRRENTFAIPVNRCSSLLSGLAATLGLTILADHPGPRLSQLIAAAMVLSAFLLLIVPLVQRRRLYARLRSSAQPLLEECFLFVCTGNTGRSAIGQALCRAEVAHRLGISPEMVDELGIVFSAGLDVRTRSPMRKYAASALRSLGVRPHRHSARPLTEGLVERSTAILCMTEQQRAAVVLSYPKAKGKTFCLDGSRDIDDPSGKGEHAYQDCLLRIESLVRDLVANKSVATV